MTSAAPTVALVRLDDVMFHPHNIRQDLGDLRALTNSIRKHGVMQPIVVEKHHGRLRLRAGHRRTAAARLAGLTRVPAVIHAEALDEDEWLIASIQENVHRAGISDEERRRTIQALLELGCTREGIGEAFGVAVTTIRRWELDPSDRKARTNPDRRKRIVYGTVRRRIADWRARGCDADTILTELEALLPTPQPRESSPAAVPGMNAERTSAKIENVEELLKAGESLHEIARRLDTTVGALARFLARQNRHDLARPFEALAQREASRTVRVAPIPDDTEQRHTRLRAVNAQIMRERQAAS